jgi:hypothetical protein
MIGILGSGFGLYGYLPALANITNEKICLLERYKEKFNTRTELLPFKKDIIWVKNLNDFFSSIETLIISLTPIEQEKILRNCLNYQNIKNFILEKPLAVSPSSSISLLSDILESNNNFRIGYTFPYTSWAESLFDMKHMQSISQVNITWNFLAHHYKNDLQNWKRFHDQGGSVLRFYGIHIIALASDIGYTDILYSNINGYKENDFNNWECCFIGKSLPNLYININSKSPKTEFSIDSISMDDLSNKRCIISQDDPFSLKKERDKSLIDSRVALLECILQSFNNKKVDYYRKYINTNLLWKMSEEKIKFNISL